MKLRTSDGNGDALWEQHNSDWREPAQALSVWYGAGPVDPELLSFKPSRDWWDILESLDIALLVTREYEHLLVLLTPADHGRRVSFLPLPHPSGLVSNRRDTAFVASTRNPNQIYELRGSTGGMLIPTRSWFLPGRLYIHDLALIDDALYANAVGENAVVQLCPEGGYTRRWWPRAIEMDGMPVFGPNYLQLNSIAAAADLESSFFSASTDKMSRRRPGHQNFAVDGRGVIFSGKTREPLVHGLTRPHSARLHRDTLWVDNSGYGEFGAVCGDRFEPLTRLAGWTRGLAFCNDTAFVGTSRVLPRFGQYAPGLDVVRAECAIYAIDSRTGKTLASLRWPAGNQIFGIDWLPASNVTSLPYTPGSSARRVRQSFYTYEVTP